MGNKFVKVYSKDGIELESFSQKTVAQTDAQKRNLLFIPRIHLVQNGESTLNFQMLQGSDKWEKVKHPENRWHANDRVYFALGENSYSYDGYTINVTLFELWYELMYQYAMVHNVDTDIEAMDYHTVRILPKSPTKNKLYIKRIDQSRGTYYNDSEVKDSRGVIQPRGSAGYALWALLKASRTGWKLGICDVLLDGFDPDEDYGTFNLETDMRDLLHNIKSVQELWGGVLVWDSKNKILHLRDETKTDSDFNQWQGFEVREGLNTTSKPTITVSNALITRGYILGNNNINIKAVNNDKEYLDDFSYTDEIYEGYLVNANIHYSGDDDKTGQRQLLNWGKSEIKKKSQPQQQISIGVLDRREESGFEHLTFDLNTIAKVYVNNELANTEDVHTMRIIEWEYNWFDYTDSTILLGDYVLNDRDIYRLIYKKSVLENVEIDWQSLISGININIPIPDLSQEWYSSMGYYGNSINLNNLVNLQVRKTTENTVAVAGLRLYADETFSTIETFTNFQAWTEESFTESSTRITQLSNALEAQIELEARHHAESLEFTSESVSELRLYVNGDFAEATLRASYNYTDNEIDEVNHSLAEFRAYAEEEYAEATVVASLNNVVGSLSVKVNDQQSSINALVHNVNDIETVVIIDPSRTLIVTNNGAAALNLASSTEIGAQNIKLDASSTLKLNASLIDLSGDSVVVGATSSSYVSIKGKSVRWRTITVGEGEEYTVLAN